LIHPSGKAELDLELDSRNAFALAVVEPIRELGDALGSRCSP
jgi:hypothetical protein